MPRTDLAVSYQQKDDVKRLGARWDADKKVWYIPHGLDITPFQRWLAQKPQAANARLPYANTPVVALDSNFPELIFNPRRIQSTVEIDDLFWADDKISLLVPDPSILPNLTPMGIDLDHNEAFIHRGKDIDFIGLQPYLPYVAQHIIVPILGDLIPSTSFGSNLHNLLVSHCWDRLRKETFALTGFRCEICGSDRNLECHELWEYHEPLPEYRSKQACGVQRLVRLMSLCRLCHETHHLGLANIRGRSEIAGYRICAYNRWEQHEFEQYCDFIDVRSSRRSDCLWVLDLSCISETLLVQSNWQLQEDGFLCCDTKHGLAETLLLGVSWQHKGILHAPLPADHAYYL